MSVSVIKSTEPKNANIFLATTAGAAVGVGARHLLPVWQSEVDSVLFGEYSRIKDYHVNQAKKQAMNEVANVAKKSSFSKIAQKLFIERMNASEKFTLAQQKNDVAMKKKAIELAKKAKISIKMAPDKVKKEIAILTNRAINNFKAARLLSEDAIKSAVKHQRPLKAFALPGAALGLLGAFVYNVVGTINRD